MWENERCILTNELHKKEMKNAIILGEEIKLRYDQNDVRSARISN